MRRSSALAALAAAGGLVVAGSAQAAELNVSAQAPQVPIEIDQATGPDVPDPGVPEPDTPTAQGTPYGSQIQVNGPAGTTITDVNVTLHGINHGWPRDLDVLLVGPQGQKVVLMSDVCGPKAQELVDKTLTFDDQAARDLPIGAVRTTGENPPTPPADPAELESCMDIGEPVKPTNKDWEDGYDSDHRLDNWHVFGPNPEDLVPEAAPPYADKLEAFNGTDPNGTWRLYVTDDGLGPSLPNPATIAGWSMQITTTEPPAPPTTTPPATPPATAQQQGPVCLPERSTKAPSSRRGKVTLSATQFRINQRIFAAGVLRANAIDRWLRDGIQTDDLCGGAITAAKLAPGITTGAGPATALTPPSPRAVQVPPLKVKKGVTFTATRAQLLINRRIAVALKERALALEARLDGKLTGGDLADGAVTQAKLASGLAITATPALAKPAPSTNVKGEDVKIGTVRRDVATVRMNQRIAADGIRILNRVRAKLQSGLTAENFADGTIVTANLAPGLRK